MNFLDNLMSDFKDSLFKDVGVFDFVLVIVLIIPLLATFFSMRIAGMFTDDEDACLKLSIKIKLISLLITAVLAFIIAQI